MLDVSFIQSTNTTSQTFYAQSGSNSWQTWVKPRNAKMVRILCVGAGGGGGGGGNYGVPPGGIAAGGNGGASGGITNGLFPAFLLPDTLYVQPGFGGQGGLGSVGSSTVNGSGTGGVAGQISVVSVSPTGSTKSAITYAVGGRGGGGGTFGSNAISQGADSTAAVTTTFQRLGIVDASATEPSLDGLVSTPVTKSAFDTTYNISIMQGAIGGARYPSATLYSGSSIMGKSILTGSMIKGGLNGGSGNPGIGSTSPFFYGTGASGGAAAGGIGGNGFYGCGAGGGAGGYSTGGNGGKGGDGLVIITTLY